jgi:AcrR family transcriptional regulator
MGEAQAVEAIGSVTGDVVVGKLERTRQKLVNAIREEIDVSGDFTAERVARRAGTSPATFYNHFASKDDALFAAYDALMIDLTATVVQCCRIESLLDAGLRRFASHWLVTTAAFFAGNAALFRLAQAAIERSREMRDLFRHHEEQVIQVFRRFIELGQAAQVIRSGDSLAMAQVLAVVSEGWYHPLILRIQPGSPLHDEMTSALVRVLGRE